MKFFKRFLFFILITICFIYCTKNNVETGVSPSSIQVINTYFGKTFSLYQNANVIIPKVAYNVASDYAHGSPGYYFLTLKDDANAKDTILSGRINMQSGTQYSLFVVQDSAQSDSAVNYTLITNDATRPLFDTCRIRFLFFARNLPDIQIYAVSQQGNTFNDTIRNIPNTAGRSYLDNNVSSARAQFTSLPAIPYKFGFYYLNDTLGRVDVIPPRRIPLNKDSLYTFYFEGLYDSLSAAKHNYFSNSIEDSLNLKIISE